VPTSYKSVLDCGLLEALGNTLLAVSHLPPDHSDLCGVSEQDLIIGDIFVFYVTIMGRAIGQPGSPNLQVNIWRIFTFFSLFTVYFSDHFGLFIANWISGRSGKKTMWVAFKVHSDSARRTKCNSGRSFGTAPGKRVICNYSDSWKAKNFSLTSCY
jgi:hypothetical protein